MISEQGKFRQVSGRENIQETVEMPQLLSIDEVVEVLKPLEEAVSITVEVLMSEARWEMEKEQQIYVNIEMYDEVQRRLIAQGMLWIPSDGKEPDSTERADDVATNEVNEEWAYVEEQQVTEQATEESQSRCVHKMHDSRQVGGQKDP